MNQIDARVLHPVRSIVDWRSGVGDRVAGIGKGREGNDGGCRAGHAGMTKTNGESRKRVKRTPSCD